MKEEARGQAAIPAHHAPDAELEPVILEEHGHPARATLLGRGVRGEEAGQPLPALLFQGDAHEVEPPRLLVEVLDETRRDAEANLADAKERLKAQTAEARAQLERDAEALGLAAAERVLGRKISSN